MDVLTSETCWALNNEIIKQVTSSWSLFIQLERLEVCAYHSPPVCLQLPILSLTFPVSNALSLHFQWKPAIPISLILLTTVSILSVSRIFLHFPERKRRSIFFNFSCTYPHLNITASWFINSAYYPQPLPPHIYFTILFRSTYSLSFALWLFGFKFRTCHSRWFLPVDLV